MAKTYEALAKSEQSLNMEFGKPIKETEPVIGNARNTDQLGNLEQQLVLFRQKNNFRVFHFTGSQEGGGVSSIIASLAQLIAGKKVNRNILLIDANLHNPVLHAMFNIPSAPGLRNVLSGSVSSSEAIHKVRSDLIHIMPCGKGEIDLSGSLGQERLSALISEIKTQYDFVVIDSPPMLTSSDSLSLAIASDITFLVIQANRTVWEVAQKSKEYLEKNGCQIGGVVLNRLTHVIPEWLYKRL